MRELTISEIKGLENGEIIPSFRGRITKVYDQKTGHSEYGQWWLQNLIVEDETDKAQVTWGGEDSFAFDQIGKTYLFESSQTDKHGLQGCKWDVRTSNGKRYEGIKLTASCKIKPMNGGDATRPRPTDPVYTEPMTEQSNAVPTSKPESAASDGINEARQHIMRAANLHILCVKAVNTVIAPNVPAIAQTGEFFQAAVASLFIEASRAGFVDKMPAKPVHNGNEKVERLPAEAQEKEEEKSW